ncbi:DUF1456 family protein [Pedobacter hiemivivus]|uniref:DUF1456 family protein n=1 Tax=Pedobacter hiemivivus TaxID=2530454 RepID=A0A4V6WPL6_9SPHI|nr:DUF1456 family protein [Pedobacter hiemivivus]TKC61486.1 DUF1456 family protein [Pedobacter hiemivivus]
MSNNDIFKKLRVALALTNDDILKIMSLVNFKVSKSELGDIFRSDDHPNFKPCGDQILRNFLNGLVIYKRGPRPPKQDPGAASA